MNPATLTSGRLFAYGFLGLPLAFAALPVYVHMPRYYAESAGLPLALLGGLLLGARLFDAVIDPWLGWLVDRMPRRRLVALALAPLVIGFVALLNPPGEFAAAWMLVSLLLTYAGYSAAAVGHQAWGADAGADSGERTRLTAAREGFALLGVVLASALPGVLAADLSAGIERLSWILPPVLLLAAAIIFKYFDAPLPSLAGKGRGADKLAVPGDAARSASGRAPAAVAAVAAPALLASLRLVLSDAAFRRLLAIYVGNGIAAALPATLFLFFVADVLHAEAASGPLLALYFVAGAASLPLWVRLASGWGRVRAWLASMALAMAAFAGAVLLGPGDVLPFAVICAASGLALGADLVFPAAIAADLGERMGRAGACFGVWNFLGQLSLALAAGLGLPLLGALGYRPESDSGSSAQGLAALSFVYALLPLAFKLAAAVLLLRWRHFLELR